MFVFCSFLYPKNAGNAKKRSFRAAINITVSLLKQFHAWQRKRRVFSPGLKKFLLSSVRAGASDSCLILGTYTQRGGRTGLGGGERPNSTGRKKEGICSAEIG